MASFDISDSDRTSDRAYVLATWCFRLSGPALLALGVILTAVQPTNSYLLAILVPLGVFALAGALASYARPLDRIEVTPEGFTLCFGPDRRKEVPWRSGSRSLSVLTMSGPPRWSLARYVLDVGWKSYAVSQEAVDALLSSARAAGCTVSQAEAEEGQGRTVTKFTIQPP